MYVLGLDVFAHLCCKIHSVDVQQVLASQNFLHGSISGSGPVINVSG